MAEITGFILDQSLNQVVPTYEQFDLDQINQMANERTAICQECENYMTVPDDFIKCRFCGACKLQTKLVRVYPLDEDGKAYDFIFPNGARYVCRLKKW